MDTAGGLPAVTPMSDLLLFNGVWLFAIAAGVALSLMFRPR